MLKIDNFKANCWLYESSLFIKRDIENFDFLSYLLCFKKIMHFILSFFSSEMYGESLIKTNVTIIIKVWTFFSKFCSLMLKIDNFKELLNL